MNVQVAYDRQTPTEAELRARIERHLVERQGKEQVAQAWDSYLSALLEWGLLDVAAYGRLSDMLPAHERRAVEEILLGFDGDGNEPGAVARAVSPAAETGKLVSR